MDLCCLQIQLFWHIKGLYSHNFAYLEHKAITKVDNGCQAHMLITVNSLCFKNINLKPNKKNQLYLRSYKTNFYVVTT